MSTAVNPLAIFRQLEQSNCRECGERTCLAFAAAIATGQKKLTACPRLSAAARQELATLLPQSPQIGHGEAHIAKLKAELLGIDLAQAAARCGGEYHDGWLTVPIFGKPCAVAANGEIRSQLHNNPWMLSPFLTYIIHGAGIEPSGEWLAFRDLPGGIERQPHFRRRAEEVMREVADRHPSLFADLASMFSAKELPPHFGADVSALLLPLPKAPVLLSYWRADEGMASELHMYFDKTAARNLDIDSIHDLCAGMAMMFGRLAQRHGGFKG
ncbi:MAG: DUF3786 domain-containing protein [Desulfobulbaceae bacterium]|jgi:hypothetical protein|nr:DUF3786 domain-containing protein [Desulfobulbaceae bacterium]